ncbi:MAG: hypothetical protein Ct9H300mP16_02030 [Pseudomonadota bacterium]|nr:MAG: hypothetical protein Ct9H300mP16_02030 [Pseudomonadota bacterium]
MLDTSMMLMASLVTRHLTTGWEPNPAGNSAWSGSPSSGAFKTSDGIIMIAANTELQFESLCKAWIEGTSDAIKRWASPASARRTQKACATRLPHKFTPRDGTRVGRDSGKHGVPAARVRTCQKRFRRTSSDIGAMAGDAGARNRKPAMFRPLVSRPMANLRGLAAHPHGWGRIPRGLGSMGLTDEQIGALGTRGLCSPPGAQMC